MGATRTALVAVATPIVAVLGLAVAAVVAARRAGLAVIGVAAIVTADRIRTVATPVRTRLAASIRCRVADVVVAGDVEPARDRRVHATGTGDGGEGDEDQGDSQQIHGQASPQKLDEQTTRSGAPLLQRA
jgi:hypothetical protein